MLPSNMKFGQLIEYNVKNISLEKSWRLVADLFLFFEKVLYKVKASG